MLSAPDSADSHVEKLILYVIVVLRKSTGVCWGTTRRTDRQRCRHAHWNVVKEVEVAIDFLRVCPPRSREAAHVVAKAGTLKADGAWLLFHRLGGVLDVQDQKCEAQLPLLADVGVEGFNRAA